MTEGWAAQDMTDELVVSLTTVRSHIRSVLRKLGVRSQLAAVALANSRDLRRDGNRPAGLVPTAPRRRPPVVLLAGPGDTTDIVANYLATRVPEASSSSWRRPRRGRRWPNAGRPASDGPP